MDVFEAVARRHSYRGPFLPKDMPEADLRQILDAGIRAPSGKNCQTTTFVAVRDPGLVRTIGQMHHMAAMQTARALIACVADREPPAVYEGYSFVAEDCAAAVENMLLAITALGYASVWIDGWLRLQDRAVTIGNLLGVPAGKVVRVLLPVGVPAESWPQKEKLPFAQRAWFDRYGG